MENALRPRSGFVVVAVVVVVVVATQGQLLFEILEKISMVEELEKYQDYSNIFSSWPEFPKHFKGGPTNSYLEW